MSLGLVTILPARCFGVVQLELSYPVYSYLACDRMTSLAAVLRVYSPTLIVLHTVPQPESPLISSALPAGFATGP